MVDGSHLARGVTAGDIETLFQIILKRSPGDETDLTGLVNSRIALKDYLAIMRNCEEFYQTVGTELAAKARVQASAGEDPKAANRAHYRAPIELRVSETKVCRVAMIGSCLLTSWMPILHRFRPHLKADVFLTGDGLPESPPADPGDYDFQIVQLPLRALLPDLAFANLRQDDVDGHVALLEHAKTQISRVMDGSMRWNRKFAMLTFVILLIEPQQNLVGRLHPIYDLRNPNCFVRKLNEHLCDVVANFQNAFCVDINAILSSFGTRYAYEDPFVAFNHGGMISDFDYPYDRETRLEAPRALTQAFETGVAEAIEAIWLEIEAMYRTIKRQDEVKLVVVDLDDTMWRGVLAERDGQELGTTEGWPIGLWEALAILKRRGLLLAIISKNEEDVVLKAWPDIFKGLLSPDDFAVRKINWAPKSQNMAEILAQVNFTPMSVVYLDDNPAQRAEIVAAFPGVRVLGGTPTFWRRILLWAPETQVAKISPESARRTEMVQAQVQRERVRASMAPDAFLASLQLKMKIYAIDPQSKTFARAHELLNKTNQFNTTGRRWRVDDLVEALRKGLRIVAFELEDRFTQYGLVGVLLVEDNKILQYVMSCRVMGLGAEQAILSDVLARISAKGFSKARAALVETEWNLPCRNVYQRCGFQRDGEEWRTPSENFVNSPEHIAVETDRAPAEESASA